MRATLDKLISWIGIVLALVLLVAGGLLTWANHFIGDQVKTQLTQQSITMPSGQALSSLPADDQAALQPYAGTPLDNGPKAKAYSDHYIAAHLKEMAQGQTFSDIGGTYNQQCSGANAAKATTPACVKLAALKSTVFQGDTLRGLLLYGYAFATMGTIAGYAAIASFIGAVLLLLLALLGLMHAKRARTLEGTDPAYVGTRGTGSTAVA